MTDGVLSLVDGSWIRTTKGWSASTPNHRRSGLADRVRAPVGLYRLCSHRRMRHPHG